MANKKIKNIIKKKQIWNAYSNIYFEARDVFEEPMGRENDIAANITDLVDQANEDNLSLHIKRAGALGFYGAVNHNPPIDQETIFETYDEMIKSEGPIFFIEAPITDELTSKYLKYLEVFAIMGVDQSSVMTGEDDETNKIIWEAVEAVVHDQTPMSFEDFCAVFKPAPAPNKDWTIPLLSLLGAGAIAAFTHKSKKNKVQHQVA